jgi:hypothetical protein
MKLRKGKINKNASEVGLQQTASCRETDQMEII